MEFQMKEIGYKTTFEYGELHVAGDVTFGFRPFQLMVSAIAGCSGSVFRKILDKKRIVYDDITIQAEVERNEEKANRIEKIHLHFIISSSSEDLDREQIQKCLELAHKNCPMVQSVEGSINITETFELK
ncbi:MULTISPECIES: OsmC family protein [Aeribacillus]|uniref:OsmC family protein n=1 Tax=Aeribacillus TaxID=1055323 RepID=UPI0007B49B21|nr:MULTISPECIES: OsmC family protein [Aeribacillus]KZM56665.1 osmotically inducible protein C [Aeribacillus pallidus]MED0651504.1 OsmC family protein [Aeribacillus composti]MED4488008.1 OsmC family protein [Aeribacillus pallidus]